MAMTECGKFKQRNRAATVLAALTNRSLFLPQNGLRNVPVVGGWSDGIGGGLLRADNAAEGRLIVGTSFIGYKSNDTHHESSARIIAT